MNESQNLEVIRHAVDNWRTARMNAKYYACVLQRFQTAGLIADLVVALSTTGAALAIWQGEIGAIALGVIMPLAAIVAIVKPILKLNQQIEHYSRRWANYNALFYDYDDVVQDIRKHRDLRPEMDPVFQAANRKFKDYALQDENVVFRKLMESCQVDTIREIPMDSFWASPAKAEVAEAAELAAKG